MHFRAILSAGKLLERLYRQTFRGGKMASRARRMFKSKTERAKNGTLIRLEMQHQAHNHPCSSLISATPIQPIQPIQPLALGGHLFSISEEGQQALEIQVNSLTLFGFSYYSVNISMGIKTYQGPDPYADLTRISALLV